MSELLDQCEIVRGGEGARYRDLGGHLVQVIRWMVWQGPEGWELKENPDWVDASHEMRGGKVVKRFPE